MKYFVTGATGFIGGRVARQLIAQGHYVNTVARNPAAARDLAEIGVKVFRGDITDKETMRGPMLEMDGVFHIAGWYKVGVRDRRPAYPINVLGTRNVLELMRELGIPKGVYTSTLAVFSDTHGAVPDESYRHNGPWLTTYDHTKWLAHYKVALPMMDAGLPLVIVQPGGVYGPGDTSLIHDTLQSYLLRRLPIVPQRTAYCWGHVDDTAEGHLLAMERGAPGQSYIIGGPVHTVIEMLQMAERITGIPAPRIQVPPGVLQALAYGMAPLGALLPLPPSYTYEGLRSNGGVTYLGSNAKARRELGFDPRPLEDGLRETLRALMRDLGMRPRA
jgi:nucleoside-diphosphate-sugar epimerase